MTARSHRHCRRGGSRKPTAERAWLCRVCRAPSRPEGSEQPLITFGLSVKLGHRCSPLRDKLQGTTPSRAHGGGLRDGEEVKPVEAGVGGRSSGVERRAPPCRWRSSRRAARRLAPRCGRCVAVPLKGNERERGAFVTPALRSSFPIRLVSGHSVPHACQPRSGCVAAVIVSTDFGAGRTMPGLRRRHASCGHHQRAPPTTTPSEKIRRFPRPIRVAPSIDALVVELALAHGWDRRGSPTSPPSAAELRPGAGSSARVSASEVLTTS